MSDPQPIDGDACARIYDEAKAQTRAERPVEADYRIHEAALVHVYAAGQRSIARPSATAIEALRSIAAQRPRDEDSIHGPALRCRACSWRWMKNGDTETHGEGCAYIIARKTLKTLPAAVSSPVRGNPRAWIGVDFDSTLVECHEFLGPGEIGKPIPLMMDRVRGWLAVGVNVRIVTARVSHNGTQQRMLNAAVARMAIRAFCLEHFGVALPVTCEKDYDMIELWDDRCVQVEANTGKLIGCNSRGFS